MTHLFIYRAQTVEPEEFVTFWFERYHDPREQLYTDNINQPLTAERVWSLYLWKAGGAFWGRRLKASVERNYVARAQEAQNLDDATDAQDFLDRFDQGGAIWRIFWLHCWRPYRYPIFDQHVWRARQYLDQADIQELGHFSDKRKIELYLNDYLPWTEQFNGLEPVRVDRALWTCGKFLKTWPMRA